MEALTAGLASCSAMLILIALGVPIGFALLGTGLVGLAFLVGPAAAMHQLSMTVVDQGTSYVMVTVPLYILMGNLVNVTGIAADTFDCVYRWVGRRRGGLAITSVLACAGFGSVSGGSVTAIVTMAPICMPAMRRFRYADSLAAGSLSAAGTLGILIPPSIFLIVYGIWTETSIGALFIAGIVPGLVMTFAYAAAIYLMCVWRPELGPVGERFTWREKLESLVKLAPVFLIFFAIMGGIYFGVCTPEEAAAVGVAGVLLVAAAMGRLNFRILRESLVTTIEVTGMVFIIVVGGHMVGKFVALTGVTRLFVDWMSGFELSIVATLLLFSLLYLFLGMLLDVWGMLILTIPFLFPVVLATGIDPVWFGVYVVIMSELALITPPVGINVYVMAKVIGDVSIATIFRGVIPFVAATLFVVALIIAFPDIVMWLPRLGGLAG